MSTHPILYQNANHTITLIDVPASIANGQGIQGRLISSQARSEPFLSTEPKTPKARNRVLTKLNRVEHEAEYVDVVSQALKHLHSRYGGPWTLPRLIYEGDSQQGDGLRQTDDLLSKLFQSIAGARRVAASVQIKSAPQDALEDLEDWDGSYHNDNRDEIYMKIRRLGDEKSSFDSFDHNNTHRKPSGTNTASFRIPSYSSFLLSNCKATHKLRNHVRWMSQEYDKSRFFDLILLDPPWENRSAKRHAAYETHSVQNLVEEMDLANYLQPGGLVGIWVTNKSAHHELVLGSGGIFQSLNVSLIEEWIWIKTTSNGEPVTQLDGIWRKPYEVLLLGRAPESRLQIVQPAEKVSRRVIAGVPDFHSRKPCLKTLIEPFLPKEYQALEVFARYLVQGWTSWGNEVLKYNYEGYYENGDP